MKLSKSDLLSIKHVQALGFDNPKDFNAVGVSTDSRAVKSNELFVAIRGEQFDGHDFITKAIASGATAVIVENKWATSNSAMLISVNVPRLVVENTVHALGQLANIHRRRFRIPIIAIGGSNGKTTTKEMVRSILSQQYNVLCTEGNLNNHIGVPQTLFRLEKKHQVAVIEIGTNHFGEIQYLCEIVEPIYGLITNIAHEHLEFFGDLDGVAKAEAELFDWLHEVNGIALLNKDDNHLMKHSKGLKCLSFGFESKNTFVKGTMLVLNERACVQLRIKPKGRSPFDVELKIPGEHNARNALAAAAVGLAMKVPVTKIRRALRSFSSTSKRMEVVTLDDITILNDSYSANPDSVMAALTTLRSMNTSGKRIAVLGDMLELGDQAQEQHRQVGKAAARNNVEYLLTYGTLSKFIHDAAHVKFKAHYDQKNMLCEYLAELLSSGDVVLIKGSRGMKMEDILTFLTERFRQTSKSFVGGGKAA